jgi:hypothetical protein
LQVEGLLSLLTSGTAYLVGQFFKYETYYLYEHTLAERNEADFMPKIQDFTFKIVSTKQQADELAAGLNFDSHLITARRRLDKGAIAFCVCVDRELAHIGWVALSKEAKNAIDSLPYHIDFSNKQAWTGATWTNPKYREKGLMAYGYFKRFQFLKERGIKSSRNAVDVGNIVSQKVHAKFSPKVYAKARYLKILSWKSWKETPLT